jgi:hypothetical protein
MMVIGPRFVLAGLALAAGLLASCSPSEKGVSIARTGDPVIVLSEGPCDLTCPVYDMTLHPDGSYLLNGVRFVKTEGVTEGRLDGSAWTAALAALDQAGFWMLEPNETASDHPTCIAGTPTVLITVRLADGKQKTLTYRAGCGGEEGRALIPALREALTFRDLIWTDERFAPDGSR